MSCAALGRAQLKKLDTVNNWRNDNYRILARELGDLPGLTAPYIPQDVAYVSHVAAFLYDAEETGLPRDLLIAAIRAEGIPMGTGYVRLMYENQTFLKKIAFGSSGSPWTDGESQSTVTYACGQCPVAEALIYEKFLWLYHIAHPSTADDMNDIIAAIKKVLENSEQILARADEIRGTGKGARSQGRI